MSEREQKDMADVKPICEMGTVETLEILPLIDFYSVSSDLETEPGVSYLIKADDTNILLDVGFNQKCEHPSPLLKNMRRLGITPHDIDMLFFSHIHADHVGGIKESSSKSFNISQGSVDMKEITVYTPEQLKLSQWKQMIKVKVIAGPELIAPGVASIGPIYRKLFLLGPVMEQSLAINLKDKGIVLIVGCGHQTVEKIIERTKQAFGLPIYAIVGGLHFPVRGGRMMKGPINVQKLVGQEHPMRGKLNEANVREGIECIKGINPQYVALSAHDSSDWVLDRFKEAFGERCLDIKVGKRLIF